MDGKSRHDLLEYFRAMNLKNYSSSIRLTHNYYIILPTEDQYYGSYQGTWTPPKHGEQFDVNHKYKIEAVGDVASPTVLAEAVEFRRQVREVGEKSFHKSLEEVAEYSGAKERWVPEMASTKRHPNDQRSTF